MESIREWLLHTGEISIAHRGASAVCPENTMAAFRQAVVMGAICIELDVQLTTDEEVVVLHDETISRTSNGTGNVASLNWRDLAQWDFGAWFSGEFRGERLPRLAEVLEWLPVHVKLNIELKGTPQLGKKLADETMKLIHQYERAHQVLISSFHHDLLAYLRERDSQLALGALFYGRLWPMFHLADALCLVSLHPQIDSIDENWVRKVQGHGIGVVAWTIETPVQVRLCRDFGIQGIIVNDLTLLRI